MNIKKTIIAAIALVTIAATLSAEPVKVKESKLTSLSYVKKITTIERVEKFDDRKVYHLENGVLIRYKGGDAICVLKKDGEVYGRIALIDKSGIIISMNYHESFVRSTNVVDEGDHLRTTTYLTEYGKAEYAHQMQKWLNQKINIYIK